MSGALSPERLAAAYRAACLLEIQALKPGNVHRFAGGHGMCVADFETSAAVSAAPLAAAGEGVGARVLGAVRATRAAVGCNTNLGIVLLCAPLLRAAELARPGEALRAATERVLARTTRADAEAVYRAIRLAAPAGLGRVDREDVHAAPRVSLRAAMGEAAHRDRIARQYATGFADLFETALPRLRGLQQRWRDRAWAAAGLYLDMLARWPDTHVARKHGPAAAHWTRRAAGAVQARLLPCDVPQCARDLLLELDAGLKRRGINPGTTADLTVATVLVSSLQDLLSERVEDSPRRLSACS